MHAIALTPGTGVLRLVDRPEPSLKEPDDIKVRIVRVGICGTDREEASGGRAKPPAGSTELVLGHEMFGVVVDSGPAVTRARAGDYVAFTVRRGCGRCLPCAMNRADMCRTGGYRERGIWGMDGYQSEYVVDREKHVVRIQPGIASTGVLCEPLSISEKAIAEAVRIQMARLPGALSTPDWLFEKRCLVAGLGPVGLLGALALRLRGAEVYGLDIVDSGSPRPRWLETIGGKYIDARKIPVDKVEETIGTMDLIMEAAGVAPIEFNLLDALGINGIYVLTGIPGGDRLLQVHGPELIRRLVLRNQVMFGSVNAAHGHFRTAADDLMTAHLRWPGHVDRLITHRHAWGDFEEALHRRNPDEIKSTIEWSRE